MERHSSSGHAFNHNLFDSIGYIKRQESVREKTTWEVRAAEGPRGLGEGEKSRDYHGMIGRGRIGASESRHSREAVFEGRLAIDQMESLANQLGAPTAARKRLQADLLPRLSGYSAERQKEIA